MPGIVIVIPVRNRKKYTQNILTQIYNQTSRLGKSSDFSVVVVDDDSTDGTKEIVKNSFSAVHLIEADGSLWWAGAIVKGMRYAITNLDADYVVWLNDDLYITENFIANLSTICKSTSYKETIVGGIVLDTTHRDWIVYSGSKARKPISHVNCFFSSDELEADVLCGNIVVVPKIIVNKIGFPDAEKLPHHGSDYEYVMRAKKAGFKVIVSRLLQAETDYTIADFIRYMPYWMQWYLQPNLFKKLEIIKGLTSRKANQNIWLIVSLHSSNRDLDSIPNWKYLLCYLNKIIRFIVVNFLPKDYVESRLNDYFKEQNPPQEVIEAVMRQRKGSYSSED
ncbi:MULTISPECIES: glycosyltransferase family 2 protein [unclassified Coleofasciculus]|uniref:glycosyltransferase family 2 protein n=1 Tax=unclassified Coleofasciculus TaxID=2692782 RepID=UPI00187F94C8|nr:MULTISPECIES: glycosyltransferase [unclassified Coleofasciculus]MBE9126708.1 glycosyltransferase family 2 protein [Coleofasciculus sp. LEGE 07081]MBE9150068.1 glycosyltransferase family 2 protein [Coleofasciculus sp. LEGE 07092]